MKLAELLDPADIAIGLRVDDVAAAASTLLRGALARHEVPPHEIDSIVAAIGKREAEGSTLCGPIALPHARDGEVRGIIVAMAVNPSGVIAGLSEPRIVIAFVSPEAQRDEHLRFLSEAARLSRDTARVGRIASAADAAAVLDAIR